MAITNAKAALEESFTPQIKTMLSAKLEEMEKEDMDEEMSKKYMEDDKMEEVEKDEMKEEKEEKMEEDLNLDEILAELEEADDSEKPMEEVKKDDMDEAVTEAEEMETEETEEEGEMEDGESDEPMDLEDMSEDDLKGFIESVIADMVEAGDLEAGEDMEDKDMEDGMEDEMENEEEVNIDELLAEIESIDEEYKYEEDDKDSKMEEMSTKYEEDDMKEEMSTYEEDDMKEGELDESLMSFFNRFGSGMTGETKSRIDDLQQKIRSGKVLAKQGKLKKFNEPSKEELENLIDAIKADKGQGKNEIDRNTGELKYIPASKVVSMTPSLSTKESLQTELNEALEANKVLSTELNEVNLLNAKLLYTNRIFKSKNLTESQKVKVLSTFDKASNVNEVELVYETLNDTTFKSSKKSINENLGSASRSVGTTKTTKPIIEINDAYKRMQELAFYDVKH